MLSAACLLIGCPSVTAGSPPRANAEPSQPVRNNCYSLLHQLLVEQEDVSLLRFIKSENSDVKKLVRRIATTSATGATLLEKFAKDDPSLRLDELWLPSGEVATRRAIASTEEQELLGQTGEKFELTLILAQASALSYASHLADVAGRNETQPDHARALAGLGRDMQGFYHELLQILQSRASVPAVNSITTNAPAALSSAVPIERVLMIDPSSMPVSAGKATLTIGALHRADGVYTGDYRINVFPYFYKNEKGTLAIIVSDDSLAGINHGKMVPIVGTATTSGKGGPSRHIDATATPVDINRGMLKLWFMAGDMKMIFEPAYHFADRESVAKLTQKTSPTP